MHGFTLALTIMIAMLIVAPRLAAAASKSTELNEYLQSELQYIATLNERSDIAGTRLYISASPVITSAMIWDSNGEQRYPTNAQVLHVLDQQVIAAEKRLTALAERAHPWRAAITSSGPGAAAGPRLSMCSWQFVDRQLIK